jgi:Zn-dependent peptidase ImmA (M78 family)
MPRVNPDILVWARETAKLTAEEAAKGLGITDARGVSALERLQQLEEGTIEPTRPMLIKMTKVYRRPLLAFYMSKPPRKGNRGQDFRTLPADYSPREDALIDVLLRNIMARQGIVRALLEDDEDAGILSFVGQLTISAGTNKVLKTIKELLGIDHTDFYAEPNTDKAFTLLREKAENAGIVVLLIGDLGSYHTKFKTEIFRGFALADKIAPFIIINDHDSHAAWSFTLIHELTHILLGQSGISGGWAGKKLEQFCNDVASEFLLPREEMELVTIDESLPIEKQENLITQFARQRNLSSSMVAYKLFRYEVLKKETWQQMSRDFRERWMKSQEEKHDELQKKDGGPSYYVIRRHRVGSHFINFIDRMIASGSLTTSKAGKILGVKPKNVQSLIEMVRGS